MAKTVNQPLKPRNRHIFTKEQCSKGGRKAREIEQECGKKLNHGVTFGHRHASEQNHDNCSSLCSRSRYS